MSAEVLDAVETVYVSTLSNRSVDNIHIVAGTPFIKAALVEHTFDTLMAQGYIKVHVPEAPIAPISKTTARKLSAIDNHTPDAAMNPPKKSQEQIIKENRAQAQAIADNKAAQAQVKADKEKVKADKAEKLAEDKKAATKKLDAAEGAGFQAGIKVNKETKPAKSVERIWTYDPKDLAGLELPLLLSTYQKRCAEFHLEPLRLETKEALIKKLTEDFGVK